MKCGETRYHHVKQFVKAGKVCGNLVLIERSYGYIVQMHFYDASGYAVDNTFDSFKDAIRFYSATVENWEGMAK